MGSYYAPCRIEGGCSNLSGILRSHPEYHQGRGCEGAKCDGVIPIEVVKPLKAGEEGPPATGKVAANFKPQPLNPGVICGAVDTGDLPQCTLIPKG